MPFTPFHWGISLLIQSLLLFLDPLALFIGSVIPDIEGITAWFILPGRGLPLHGPLHSFTGAIFLGLIVGTCSWMVFTHIIPFIVERLHLELPIAIPQYSLRCSLLSAFIGTFSHIILDTPLYPEMDLVYPFGIGNPWYGVVPGILIYSICTLSFFAGIIILSIRFSKKRDS
ncbi:MAG: hypothetical protein ACFFB5_22985 [Promethearchaeota archaeon]